MSTPVILSQTLKEKVDQWLTKYPADQKQSAVIQALMWAQEEHEGWLTREIIDAVADYLEMPRSAAYEVATFYSMYDLKPVGKHKVAVCTNISCMLRDCDKIVAHLEKRLGIKMGETTPDGRFTLRAVECMAACANAPMMQIGHTYHEDLTPEKVDTILDTLK